MFPKCYYRGKEAVSEAVEKLPGGEEGSLRLLPRLGFRDIASSTNERTMISTIIPPAFYGHTLSAARLTNNGSPLIKYDEQLFLCAILNSFVLD